MAWWIVEEPDERISWLTIGPYTIPLYHLRYGDDKALRKRQIVRRDFIMNQSTWPRHRIMNFTFTNLLRNAKIPRRSENPCVVGGILFPAARFEQFMRDYPGRSAELLVPEPTAPVQERKNVTYFGVIIDHSVSELKDDKVEINITLDVFREYYPEGAMRLV